MFEFAKLFAGGTLTAPAHDLKRALGAAEAERDVLRGEEAALSEQRTQLLLLGDDAELDRVEAELARVRRAIDRHDVRIPELRRVHSEQRESETRAANLRDFSSAVAARVKTAHEIDSVLTELGRLFDELEQSGATLRRLNGFHRSAAIGNGPLGNAEPCPDLLRGALAAYAPRLAKALGLDLYGGMRPGSFGDAEEAFWERVQGTIRPSSTTMEAAQ